MKQMPRYWMTRALVALLACTICTICILEPESITAHVIIRSGPAGYVVIHANLFLSIVALIDIFVNDVLPDRFSLVTAKSQRHVVYMALALGMFVLSFVIAWDARGFRAAMLMYWLVTMFSVWVAYLDLFSRHKKDDVWRSAT